MRTGSSDPAAGLRAALSEAHRRYTRQVNFREGWRGYLGQGRFASVAMDEPYLLAARQALARGRPNLDTRPGDLVPVPLTAELWSRAIFHRTVAPREPSVLVYDDRKGLYGGAAIKGGAIAPDEAANRVYYEKALTMSEILFENKVKPTETAAQLAVKITERSKVAQK